MIETFLRMFRVFRDLEFRAAMLESRLERQESELERWRDRAATVEAELRQIQKERVDEAHRVADHFSLRAAGRRVFSQVDPTPPPDWKPATANLGSGRQQARTVAAAQARQTQDELVALWDSVTATH